MFNDMIAIGNGSSNIQVETGSVTIVKDGTDNVVEVGFEPDIIFLMGRGSGEYHTTDWFFRDSTTNPSNVTFRGFFSRNWDSAGNFGRIAQGTTPSYPNYPYIWSITSTGCTFRTNSSCTDTTMDYVAIKYM